MKWLTLFLVPLLVLAMFLPCLLVIAQPSMVPHEDPAAAQSTLDSYAFLTQYVQIFSLISAKDYANASLLSEQLSHISVPADLTYIISRYNNLTQQFIEVLSDVQVTLDNASNLLNQYRLDEAGQALDHAGVQVAQAQILLSDLGNATSTLSQQLGVFASSAQSKVQQAYSQLQAILQQLNDLVNQYHALLQRDNQKNQQIKSQNLESTKLTLTLNATQCFVGGYLNASGVLKSGATVLGGRDVKLLLDGSKSSNATTRADGSYNAVLMIPYTYVDNMSVTAVYTPAGSDVGVYLASVSAVTVQVLFYNTIVNVTVDSAAYPGLPLGVNGSVVSDDGIPLNGRQVSLLLDGTAVNQVVTDQAGSFFSKFTLDPTAELGSHNLTVTVDPSGLYAGATIQATLIVEKMATEITVKSPSFVILPSQLQVSGIVSSAAGPLNGETVVIKFANVLASARTLGDGKFNLTVNMPINSLLVGPQNLSVTVQPSEPWQASEQESSSVFALNSVSIGVALASSLSVFFVAYTKVNKTKGKNGRGAIGVSALSVSPQTLTTAAISPSMQMKIGGNKALILNAYVDALKAVELATGFSLMPNMTLHEYAQIIAEKMGGSAGSFFQLTSLAELSLYSPQEPEAESAVKAKSLAVEIGRALVGSA